MGGAPGSVPPWSTQSTSTSGTPSTVRVARTVSSREIDTTPAGRWRAPSSVSVGACRTPVAGSGRNTLTWSSGPGTRSVASEASPGAASRNVRRRSAPDVSRTACTRTRRGTRSRRVTGRENTAPFCAEHDVAVVIGRMTATSWSSARHPVLDGRGRQAKKTRRSATTSSGTSSAA
ncbi:Uncharacterised protein [Mycobacteroides abscessus]|nr:Uncharacterised protein [Mycobacteroides abscessus]